MKQCLDHHVKPGSQECLPMPYESPAEERKKNSIFWPKYLPHWMVYTVSGLISLPAITFTPDAMIMVGETVIALYQK